MQQCYSHRDGCHGVHCFDDQITDERPNSSNNQNADNNTKQHCHSHHRGCETNYSRTSLRLPSRVRNLWVPLRVLRAVWGR